ncbi:MAG TPA: hypothetical protein VIL65_15935 [Beijerinckiaceae bacterium]|jgi:branched-subunit amino acid ABC-type transport system permease component
MTMIRIIGTYTAIIVSLIIQLLGFHPAWIVAGLPLALALVWFAPPWIMRLGAQRPTKMPRERPALGIALGLGFVLFALYNAYTLIYDGVIFAPEKRAPTYWITFDAHPVRFAFAALIYASPLIIGGIWLLGRWSSRREAERAVLRSFADGSHAPPPLRRSLSPVRGGLSTRPNLLKPNSK